MNPEWTPGISYTDHLKAHRQRQDQQVSPEHPQARGSGRDQHG
ncbi:hypothetical protein QJQ45_025494 [Haematococcus lacustris]|nr:hypothetical protein QJQ45_025494 [Haematococcus lacustris]